MNIVQIGTNKGNDDLTDIVKLNSNQINKLILVEPLKIHHECINECYKEQHGLYIESFCITDDEELKELTFYYHIHDGPGFEVAGTSKEHILKHSIYNDKLTEDGIVSIQVPCLTLNKLFERHNLTDIDFLYIDVEGLDDKLVYSIDLNRYNIQNIIYENLHIDSEKLINYLDNMGYDTIINYGNHGWSNLSIKRKLI